MNELEEKTFIMRLWSGIFNLLRYISIFEIIRVILGKDREDGKKPFVKSYLFVDIWVTAHLILSFISIYIIKNTDNEILNNIIIGYGLLRIFEVFVYQVNVLLFDEYRTSLNEKKNNESDAKHSSGYYLRSYRRIIVLLVNNFIEIIFWFSSAYLYFSEYFTPNIKQNSTIEIIYKSFVKMTNFGSIVMEPNASIGMEIIWFESIVGLFMTLIVLSRFIGLLPKPNTLEESEKEKNSSNKSLHK